MVCKSIKNELLTKLLKGASKLTDNFQEVVLNGFPYIKNLQNCKLQLSALRVFKSPEITYIVEFIFLEAGANGLYT